MTVLVDAPTIRVVVGNGGPAGPPGPQGPAGGIPEAPNDGNEYVRKNNTWAQPTAGGIADAPNNANEYVRKGAAWVLLTRTALATTFAPAGGLEATNVQAALVELDTEKVGKVPSADNALVRFDGIGGAVQSSSATLTDAGVLTVPSVRVDDEAYGPAWNGSLAVPTKNALYDYLNALGGVTNPAAAAVVFTPAGSLQADDVQAALEELDAEKVAKIVSVDNVVVRFDGTGGAVQTSPMVITDAGAVSGVASLTLNANTAYGAGWANDLSVPTKKAVYDKIETLGSGNSGGGLTSYATLAALKAASPTPANGTTLALQTADGNVFYTYRTGDYTGLADDGAVVKLDAVALATGALVRQDATGITFKGTWAQAKPQTVEEILAQGAANPDQYQGADAGARLAAMLTNKPAGKPAYIPNGTYVSAANTAFHIKDVAHYEIEKDVSLVGLRAAGNEEPALRIAINANSMGAENRAMRLDFKGARILFTPSGGTGTIVGGHALAVNDQHALDIHYPVIGMDIYNLQAVGGSAGNGGAGLNAKAAVGIYGGDPSHATPSIADDPETLFVRLHDCQLTGGAYLGASDGSKLINCHGLPLGDLPFVEVNMVSGAFNSGVYGGTCKMRGGMAKIVNTDFFHLDDIQAEIMADKADNPYYMLDVIGTDREVRGLTCTRVNFGNSVSSTGNIGNIRLLNCRDAHFAHNFIGVTLGGNDLTLGNNARGTIWGPQVYRGNRSRVTANVMTDGSRLLQVQAQSTAVYANEHRGLWTPWVPGVNWTTLRGSAISADAAHYIPPYGGPASGQGIITAGNLTAGDTCFLPLALMSYRDETVTVPTVTGKTRATLYYQSGGLITTGALPDAAIPIHELIGNWEPRQKQYYAMGI